MVQDNHSYSNRVTSAFPLSIGTSLAFESMFTGYQQPYDPERKIPELIDYKKYDILYINIKTLIRNIIGSLTNDEQKSLSVNSLYYTLLNELDTITSVIKDKTQNMLRLMFYFSNYVELKEYQRVKVITLRNPTTDKQLMTEKIEEAVIDKIFKERDLFPIIKSSVTDFKDKKLKSLIITHIPYDLVSYKEFKLLDLLETHTGKLKHFNEFNSKYYPIPDTDMSNLPFNNILLLILGDKVMFKPYPIKIRKGIIDVSINKKWTPLTTITKVKADIISANIDSLLPMFINTIRSKL